MGFGIILTSFWDSLGSFRDRVGTAVKPFWGRLGTVLTSLLDPLLLFFLGGGASFSVDYGLGDAVRNPKLGLSTIPLVLANLMWHRWGVFCSPITGQMHPISGD